MTGAECAVRDELRRRRRSDGDRSVRLHTYPECLGNAGQRRAARSHAAVDRQRKRTSVQGEVQVDRVRVARRAHRRREALADHAHRSRRHRAPEASQADLQHPLAARRVQIHRLRLRAGRGLCCVAVAVPDPRLQAVPAVGRHRRIAAPDRPRDGPPLAVRRRGHGKQVLLRPGDLLAGTDVAQQAVGGTHREARAVAVGDGDGVGKLPARLGDGHASELYRLPAAVAVLVQLQGDIEAGARRRGSAARRCDHEAGARRRQTGPTGQARLRWPRSVGR